MAKNQTAHVPMDRRRVVSIGGAAALGLSLLAAVGISGRDGLGEPEVDDGPPGPPDPLLRPARWPDRVSVVDRLPIEGRMPSLDGAIGWINSQPLTAATLRGKVVVVEFWTYSCINWRRQLPYVRAWAQRYGDQGLVVSGVHAPEFAFERDAERVRRATREMQIAYPVAIDSDHAIWQAFDNSYWPALYFIDAKGQIRHHHFGEGEYETSEMVIRQLLAEAGAHTVDGPAVAVDAREAEAAADWRNLASPETYVGYRRTHNFASGSVLRDERHVYAAPAQLPRNHWSLAGTWTIGAQSAVGDEAGARLAFRFHARDLHLVMGPARDGSRVRFRVRIDGQPPGDAHGVDVDEQGDGAVTEPRMYQLIRQPGTIGDRLFELELLDPGVEVFAFTFG
jgi:thiol-disulfide isomerase/thioredoxin